MSVPSLEIKPCMTSTGGAPVMRGKGGSGSYQQLWAKRDQRIRITGEGLQEVEI
jgi:hypothetical protein